LRFFLTKNAFFSSYGISQLMQADSAVELTRRCTSRPYFELHPQPSLFANSS
jgi:hypothetical protein